jgi:hypothetical protein
MEPKTWKAGRADEAWKVLICARDHEKTENTLSYLVYILTDAGNDKKRGLDAIREMTGSQIINALEAHQETCTASIAAALTQPPNKG